MKKLLSVGLFLSIALLSACSEKPVVGDDLEQKLTNPLYAERYYEELVDHMVTLVIQNDPLSKSGATQKTIDDVRRTSIELAREATAKQMLGATGFFVSDRDYVVGEALLLDNTLYFGPDFTSVPGVNLHVYLTTLNDPRDSAFPDESAVDLGLIQEPFGAQQFAVPASDTEFATVVLHDEGLGLIYGFVQLRKAQ